MAPRKTKQGQRPRPGPRSTGRLQAALDRTATEEIRRALQETAGNVAAAARLLGINRRSLIDRMEGFGIRADEYRPHE